MAGNLQKPEQHVGVDYKTLNEGYFESGIELNQIFKGLGLTAFYRYGPNQLPKFEYSSETELCPEPRTLVTGNKFNPTIEVIKVVKRTFSKVAGLNTTIPKKRSHSPNTSPNRISCTNR
jgi:hypothetical protein